MASGWRAFVLWLIGLAAVTASARGGPWPAAESDLPIEPRLRSGVLSNGLRYFVLPNAEPKNRVSLRLVVAVGALHEQDDESGLAHFVEHMAFRGTRTHPAGSLTQALQRLGVGRGPDNTAFTSYDHTRYHLELPDASEKTLREGLEVFREYAEEVTFDEKLIDRERGVILNENATRDTPPARSALANVGFLWPNSRVIRRPLGGTNASLRELTRAQFVQFYDAWYRPERMAVILTGDVDPTLAIKAITAELGAIRPRGPARPEPPDLYPASASRPDVAIYSDPGFLGVQISFEHPLAKPPARSTHAQRVQLMRQAMAFSMLQFRLQRLATDPNTSFVSPTAQIGDPLPRWQTITIAAAGKTDDWQQVAAEIEREHRRAFEYGFTGAEFEEAKRICVAGFEEMVRTAPTRRSEWLAEALVQELLAGMPCVAPADLARDLEPEVRALTAADCLQAFRDMWSVQAPHVFIAANPSFNITREQIAAVLNGSRGHEVERRPDEASVEFAYTDFGPAGQLVRERQLEDLSVRLTEFANGVRLNFKPTKFEADVVDVHVRVGNGKLSQPRNLPGLDLLANAMFTSGGLRRHSASELARIMAGSTVTLRFDVQSDALVFSVRCARRDFTRAVQLIAAYLTDAAYRPDLIREARARFGSMYAGLAASPGGPVTMNALREIARDDPRFGIPPADQLAGRTTAQVREWIEPQLKHGAVEMSVVGDIEWDEVAAATAKTLGALPRHPVGDPNVDAKSSLRPARPEVAPRVFHIDPKLKLGAVAWYCPVAAPLEDYHEDRRCRLLAAVLSDRVNVKLRDQLGAAYSIGVAFNAINGFPSLDHFVVYAEVAPGQIQRAIGIIEHEAMALSLQGVSAEEFERAKPPYLREMEDNLRTNLYWGVTVLSDAQQRPSRIDAARDRARDIAAMTREEINAIAARHLDVSRAFNFATTPVALTLPAKPGASGAKAGGRTVPYGVAPANR